MSSKSGSKTIYIQENNYLAKLNKLVDINFIRQALRSGELEQILPYGEVFKMVNYQDRVNKR